jgi:hypothetical protein
MCEFLPLFLVRWFARHGCERVSIRGAQWHTARPDVLIRSEKPE